MGGHGNFWHILRNSLPVVPWNWIIVLQIEIFFYSLQRSEMEKQMAVIEKEKALYQFEVLKNQINPHFLFNSLNVLASLALNLPLCIGLGFIDFGVINLIYKRLKQRNNAVRILVDIVLTTALAVLLTYILNSC